MGRILCRFCYDALGSFYDFVCNCLWVDNEKLHELQKFEQTFAGVKIENVTKYQADVQYQNVEKMIRENLSTSNSVKLVKSEKGLIIRVNDRVLFDEGSADIKPEAQNT